MAESGFGPYLPDACREDDDAVDLVVGSGERILPSLLKSDKTCESATGGRAASSEPSSPCLSDGGWTMNSKMPSR